MNSRMTKLLTLAMVLTALAANVFGQGKTISRSFDAESAFLINGLNALVLEKDGQLILEMIPPKEQLPKELKDLKLKEGDEILMLNGKRVKTISDLRDLYDAIEVGEPVKFGIKNESGMGIVSFNKPSGEGHGGRVMMMTTTMDGDGDGGDTETKMFGPGGKEINVVPVFDAGIMLAEEDKGVVIVVVMPDGKEKMNGELPDGGDVIQQINGKKVSTMDEFNAIYEDIAVGKLVKIQFMRDGKELSFSFDRSKEMPSGEVMIKRESK